MKWRILAALAVAACGAVAAAQAPPPAAQGVRWVYLVRHGMYERDRDADDRVGNALNALGHEQAKLTGERLARLPVKMGALVASDFTRARETAVDMGRILGLEPALDSLIHECTPTSVRADLMKNEKPAAIALCESNLEAAWQKYMQPSPEADTYAVLVCHGNVIRWFACKALGVDTKRWASMDIGNGSLTVIGVRADGSTKLAALSDTGHIPPERQTWTGRGAGWSPKN